MLDPQRGTGLSAEPASFPGWGTQISTLVFERVLKRANHLAHAEPGEE